MFTGLSDHNLILVARKRSNKRFSPCCEYESLRIPRNKQENFKNVFHQTEWSDLTSGTDLEEDSQIFSKVVESIIREFTCKLRHKNKTNTLSWMNARNATILELMKKMDYALKNANKTKSAQDRHHFTM